MKIISLLILLSFCWLLCLPIMAEPQQSLVSDDVKLAFSESANGNNITQTRVNLNTKAGQVQANHGEVPVGVVGIKISERLGGAIIIEEYPPSNLWKLGIVPGDKVVGVEGQPVNFITFEDQCHGRPGRLRNLTIVHNGQIRNIAVPLVDARMMVQYNPGFQQSASMTVQW